ncbi:MAG TPA: alcohol dehydrogenase catalytic domain-containing protein, partial [Dehalococcoidia bacterium]|nr:alcohol dehydrogenase catalytic domain-containing protein [Dehalococcoidia bacterium]
MRAAVWTDDRDLRIVEKPLPTPGPGEVRVVVGSAGICGSDLHWFRGDFPPQPGLTPGHEIGGTIDAVGAGVNHVREGDIVGVEPSLRCGDCEFCNRGEYQHCRRHVLLGIALDGGLEESVVTPGYTVFNAPAAVDPELAAVAEPLACGVHGFQKVGLAQDETVLVQGAGSIGLTALLAARAYGAKVLITARHAHQREAAERLGATEVIMDDEAGERRLAELAKDQAIDVVAEAVGGHADTIRVAVETVRPMGRVAVLGVFAMESAGLNPLTLLGKEVSVIGANTYSAPNGESDYARGLE